MLRSQIIEEIQTTSEWDILVIGGGATGLGAAVDAASRGYKTLLLEAYDFAKGTSSRSTKLVHGGVRYLQQGDIRLVLDALRERGRMLRNAPHLAHKQSFVIPAYEVWQAPFYGIGLTVYDLLARGERLGRSRILSRQQTIAALPGVKTKGLKAGILYYDGQFDDARYAIALLRTLQDLGGVALNYARVTGLMKSNEQVTGVAFEDVESATRLDVRTKIVINATGIFSDEVRRMDEPGIPKIVTASQGTHVVLPRSFLRGDAALMVPRTADGRVLFAIPWHDNVVVGTTDDPVPQPEIEPKSMVDERTFLLDHVEKYFGKRPGGGEIRSVWSGQRPLVSQGGRESTAKLSRDHTILVTPSKLVTIIGGKWTTYRKMAEDVINRAARLAGLPERQSPTANIRLHGWSVDPSIRGWRKVYGADLSELETLIGENNEFSLPLHTDLPFWRGEVVWAARHEMARTVEDVLARRTRALFLDARAARECAPVVARLLATELDKDDHWQATQLSAFDMVAQAYVW